MYKVLVTGDRNWTDLNLILGVLLQVNSHCLLMDEKPMLIHGAARGADTLAGQAGEMLNWPVNIYPADWKRYGKRAGPIRNIQMIKQEPDVVIAFHDDLENSKGTKDMVETAKKFGIEVRCYTHHESLL